MPETKIGTFEALTMVFTAFTGASLEHNVKQKRLTSSFFRKTETTVQKEIDAHIANGFRPIAIEGHVTLILKYFVDGMVTQSHVNKRHLLETLLDEALGWTRCLSPIPNPH